MLEPDKRVLFDISDMLFYLGHHRNVSGIQRVQSNFVRAMLSKKTDNLLFNFEFVISDMAHGNIIKLEKDQLHALTTLLSAKETDHEMIKSGVALVQQSEQRLSTRSGDIYMVTGAFWIYPEITRFYNVLKKQGIYIGCYIYDLIPIKHPEFCTSDLTQAFRSAFWKGCHFFDFILTISEYTAEEVYNYITTQGLPSCLITAVPLAHVMTDDSEKIEFNSKKSVEVARSPFILSVGTIEARKNHLYLFQLWKLMIENAKTPVPDLVIVGRWGWRINDLREQIEATNYLNGKIIILSEIDDHGLKELYRKCIFTMFPSFVEGWGLPVGESLTHGKLCVASSTSSIPEVGKDFVLYCDPFNVRDGYNKVISLLNNQSELKAQEDRIRTDFRQTTWDEFASDFCLAITEVLDHKRLVFKPAYFPVLEPDELVYFSRENVMDVQREDLLGTKADLICTSGWHQRESLGCWMNGRTSECQFLLVSDLKSELTLFFNLFSVPWASEQTIVVNCNGTKVSCRVPSGVRFDLELRLLAGASKIIKCEFELIGEFDHSRDPRDLCVGLSSFFYSI